MLVSLTQYHYDEVGRSETSPKFWSPRFVLYVAISIVYNFSEVNLLQERESEIEPN